MTTFIECWASVLEDAKTQKMKRNAAFRKKREKKGAPNKMAPKFRNPPDYYSYIKSATWAKKREAAFLKHGRKCCVCGSTSSLHVHHKTYSRLGRERLTDLEIRCADCHAVEHNKPDSLTGEFNSVIG